MAQLSDSISRSHAIDYSMDTTPGKSSLGMSQKPDLPSKFYNVNGAVEIHARIARLKQMTGVAVHHQEFVPPPKEIKLTINDLDRALAQTRATQLTHQRIEQQRLKFSTQFMRETTPTHFDRISDENKLTERLIIDSQPQSNKFELNNPILNTYIEKIYHRKRKLAQKLKDRSKTGSPLGERKQSTLGEEEPEPRLNSKFCYKTGVPFFHERINLKFKPDNEVLPSKFNSDTDAVAMHNNNMTTSFDYMQFVTETVRQPTKPSYRASTSRKVEPNQISHRQVSKRYRPTTAQPSRDRSSEVKAIESSQADSKMKKTVPPLQLTKSKNERTAQFDFPAKLEEDILENGVIVDYDEWKDSLLKDLLNKKESQLQTLSSSKKPSSRPYSHYSTARKKISDKETGYPEKISEGKRTLGNSSNPKTQRGKSAELTYVKESLTARERPNSNLLVTFSAKPY